MNDESQNSTFESNTLNQSKSINFRLRLVEPGYLLINFIDERGKLNSISYMRTKSTPVIFQHSTFHYQ